MTTKPLSLDQCLDFYQSSNLSGITIWRNVLERLSLSEARRRVDGSALKVVSLCRGGFFPARTAAERQAAIDDNRLAIDQAQALGAPLVVLVCGAVPGMPLSEARRQITDGIAAVLPYARQAGVKLAIEPLHPMYAGDRSAVNTLRQANDMVAELKDDHVGVALDVYHVWWDPELREQIARCAALKALLAFHVCDWRVPTRDMLNDRALMGDGCINIREIRGWVEEAGFTGFIEAEIFSTENWQLDQRDYLAKIKKAYLEHC
ncbi:TIM barrel protein [bacterium]|nr:TIM barrel protein [bacterium]